MAVKSIIDIDVDRDGRFAAFTALYEKYEKALATAPKEWAKVTANIGRSRSEFDNLVKAQIASLARSKLMAEVQREAERVTRSTADKFRDMARNTREVAGNIRDTTVSLLRWGAITGVISGLVGGGGLYGIDRLALGVAASRRSSMGLNVGYGEQRAFGTNFSRLVDGDHFLSSVSAAKTDVNRRVGLIGAGLNEREIGGSNSDTAVALLRNLMRIADSTNPALYAQVLSSRRLDQFASPEDLQRLRNTPAGERAALFAQYEKNKNSFDLPKDVQRGWQEFATQMSRAGQNIENTFVRGLAPLTPGLTRLSESVATSIKTFLSSDKLATWIDKFGTALEKAAKYIGTDQFQGDINKFVNGVGKVANAIAWLVGKLPSEFNSSGAAVGAVTGGLVAGPVGAVAGGFIGSKLPEPNNLWSMSGGAIGYTASPFNNPGNMRPPGRSTGFMAYKTSEDGVRAMARQLQLYANRDKLDTVSSIVSKYAPASENNTAAYVGDVSKRTGYGPGQRLDLNNPDTMARLLAAMIAHENRAGMHDKYKDAKVVIEIIKPAGGDTAVSVNGLKN